MQDNIQQILLNSNSFRWTHKHKHTTSGFVQLGLDVEAIIGSAFPSFGFGGRNSTELLLVNFGF
jgi:hypothetical protein